MAISKKEFESYILVKDRTKEVLTFLRKNKDRAYTYSEISKETKVPSGTLSLCLINLEKKKLVKHKKPYWIAWYDGRKEGAITRKEIKAGSVGNA